LAWYYKNKKKQEKIVLSVIMALLFISPRLKRKMIFSHSKKSSVDKNNFIVVLSVRKIKNGAYL